MSFSFSQLTTFSNKDDSKKTRKATTNGFLLFTLSISRDIPPSLDFETDFNYLQNGQLITIDIANLPSLIKAGLIVTKKQNVRALHFKPNLWKHGFESRRLPERIQELLTLFRDSRLDYQKQIRDRLRNELESLVSGYFNLPAVAFDAVYRNTDEGKDSTFKSVPLVHVDFPKDLQKTLDSFREQWYPRVLKKLGDRYHAKDIQFMINIWMPLDIIVASPLVLCSNDKLDSTRFYEYDAVRRDQTKFKAISLTPPEKKNDPWFYQPGMKGQCYMFLSTDGVHSAAQFPHETGTRESIEVRLGIFKK